MSTSWAREGELRGRCSRYSKLRKKVVLVRLILLTGLSWTGQTVNVAQAGAWNGAGGGELIGDLLNPWFLHSGQAADGGSRVGFSPVRYCVASSRDFPQRIDVLETLVQSSLEHWHTELSNAHIPENRLLGQDQVLHNVSVNLNTWNFVRTDNCATDDVELKFQFGYLDPEQLDNMKNYSVDLTRIIGLSIRTHYNVESMQGKGFVYIAADGSEGNRLNPHIPKGAWQGEEGLKRLRGMVIHEIGHIHGLQHASGDGSIMSPRFAEDLLSEDLFEKNRSEVALSRRVFFANVSSGMILPTSQMTMGRRFLELPESVDRGDGESNSGWVYVKYDLNGVKFYEGFGSFPESRLVAKARFVEGGQRKYRPLVNLWLPKGQNIFPRGLDQKLLAGPSQVEVQNAGEIEIVESGSRKPIFVQFSPSTFQIGSLMDGKIVPDLFHYSNSTPGWNVPSPSGWQE